ncbi:MAG: peptide chain release factor N(5)-glutamine methyltransferase [Rikenellaceae bacterium]
MGRRELLNHLTSLAEPIYGRGEATQIARMILEEVGGVSYTQIIADPDAECEIKELERIEREITACRPIQYIIGEADFCGFRVAVREGVLIPRPESEELIEWVVSEATGSERILDIGTGSGALSIALSSALPQSDVTAIDISKEALEIARQNGALLAPKVKFVEGDALRGVENYVEGEFDIILSNPPYIPQCEQVAMRKNVVDFEPHLALFVPDNDPLLFYREIARSAKGLLSKGGKLYYEIHENFAEQTAQMVKEEGFKEVEIRRDINDKARMICAKRG